jgi:hypothetical protein
MSALVVGEEEGSGLAGSTVDSLSGLSAERLEAEYGYSGEEAAKAAVIFRQMKVPAGKERYYETELSPVIRQAVGGSRDGEGLRRNLAGALRNRADTVYNVGTPAGRAGYLGDGMLAEADILRYAGLSGGSGPVYARQVTTRIPVKGDAGTGLIGGRSAAPVETSDIVSLRMPAASGQGTLAIDAAAGRQVDIPKPAQTNLNTQTQTRPETQTQPETGAGEKIRQFSARDAELERLRRIEANSEKDKAMLAREKVPALARSDSHDVGHAEGNGNKKPEVNQVKKMNNVFREAIIDEIVNQEL